MSAPSDQSDRRRFAEELETNFSVIASAGSGKTRAITDRILEIARARDAVEILPHLVVVTFTNRAADEMQQRTRQLILAEKLPAEVVSAFNRAFFGTIHAFCMKLLTNYGHYLGLPTPLELITDDDNLWQEFVQQQTRLGRNLSKENRAALFRLAQARDIMELGRRAGSALLQPGAIGACPTIDFSQVHAVPAKGSGASNIIEFQGRAGGLGGEIQCGLGVPPLANLPNECKGIRRALARSFRPAPQMGERDRTLRGRGSAARLPRFPPGARRRHLRGSNRARR